MTQGLVSGKSSAPDLEHPVITSGLSSTSDLEAQLRAPGNKQAWGKVL